METLATTFSLMGILNVTPDSFFDGGEHFAVDGAVDHAMKLLREGAHIIDIGGASSRPGAEPVPLEEERRRVIPVVKALSARCTAPLSVDTTSGVIAREAAAAGVSYINDISAGKHDPDIVKVIAETGCRVILMHSRGTPQTMAGQTGYDSVVDDVVRELLADVKRFRDGGVCQENIVIDPGIGFAKTTEQNLSLLAGIERFVATGYPVLLGTSRKSFIGAITGRDVSERLYGSLGSIAGAYLKGVAMFRVHDVAATADFLRVMDAVA